MFKSAVVKLTAWYVGALVLVCLVFSVPMYSAALSKLRRGAEMQTDIVRRLPESFGPGRYISQLEKQRERQLDKDKNELLATFVAINGIIIMLGGAASYLFARRTLQPIEDAHKAQAQFTANASHELRTPLAVMQTEIDVALRNKTLTIKDAKEILASNLEEVERLRHLSDQLLGLTRADTPLHLQKTNVSKLVQDEVKVLAKRYKQDIAIDVTQKLHATIDPVLYKQVLDILVDNAITYGGAQPRVTVLLHQAQNDIVLQVTDNGPGISEADQAKIFERFYRGSNATTIKSSGHGLGLALAKEIVQKHGGIITVKSIKNKGTTFSVIVPVHMT